MHAGIDFLAEDLFGALDSQAGDFVTQGVTRTGHLLLGFGLGGSNDLVAFLDGLGLGFFDDALGTALGISQARLFADVLGRRLRRKRA